jgi:hypothetical protein
MTAPTYYCTFKIKNREVGLTRHSIMFLLNFTKCSNGSKFEEVPQLVEALRYTPNVTGSIPDGVTGSSH